MTQHSNQYSNPESVPDNVVQAESDLFNAIVNRDDVRCEIKHPIDASTIEIAEIADSKIAYPWNPVLPESSNFFNYLDIDADTPLNAFDDAEIEQQSSNFFNQLDQLWDSTVQTALTRKFASVPQQILNSIAAQAEQLLNQGDNLADQLANCVQSALPNWAIEDLQVLARPMAYAMRGDTQTSPLLNRDWQTLSATEQAKLSLTIARYAIDELNKPNKQS
ncbi:hypothetical protein IQ266_00665 [filamentous cyanobacterium LEGE 11480]|uniref:Uncharacterized protein n=1 Tax=Romeriopsis navalis LEGE 11480 TaxID=2777977 RepID=A0A928VGN3_9CYAN|nr:hypothetical protein [Romeriopsis navalis]MBE9028266.1 hypothetical protein [Romeriopsis navalis LEGE 11480]